MKIIYLMLGLVLLFGCILSPPLTVKDINDNPEKYLGEKVTVSGIARDSFKLGELSGFTLEDGNSSIFVSSDMLPAEDKNVTVSGTVMKEVIVGYYILAKDVQAQE
ncbi:MAG: hypothetical protein PHF60_05540 [Candidatus ainarchaeum sp.]|nr:hypothetical protein [Candidatus ainarchaeum sp.]